MTRVGRPAGHNRHGAQQLQGTTGDTILASNVYECMFILDSNRYSRDPNGIAGQIPTMIEESGGEVLASRLWNEQRLAYPIQGQRKGSYWLTYFRMETEKVTEFNRACRLNDNVLRNLTLRVDPRLVDTLVAHARGEVVPAADEAAAEETAGEVADAPAVEVADAPAEEKVDATEVEKDS